MTFRKPRGTAISFRPNAPATVARSNARFASVRSELGGAFDRLDRKMAPVAAGAERVLGIGARREMPSSAVFSALDPTGSPDAPT